MIESRRMRRDEGYGACDDEVEEAGRSCTGSRPWRPGWRTRRGRENRKPGWRRRADDIRPCGIVNGGGEPPPYMVKNELHIGKREQREGSDGMIISKDAGVDGALELNPQELAQINAWSRRELKAEEVYAFAVKLCDNEVDRDWERFPAATLEELAPLFAGKSGLFDHQWSAREQTARIYRTEVVREARLTGAGEPYCYLKGYAYLLRTEGNRELIAEIEGGIKKEVSVGCAVERAVCSICGQDIHTCPHEKGEEYGGQQCWADLVGATDAYEWSFVAVPAQKNAGVMKHWRLEQEAALGRKYLEGLRSDVVRLGGLAGLELEHGTLKAIAARLEYPELTALRKALEKQADRRFPAETQLTYGEAQSGTEQRDGAFLI